MSVRPRRLEVLRQLRIETRAAAARNLAEKEEALVVAERAVSAAAARSREAAARTDAARQGLARMAAGHAAETWRVHSAWSARTVRERRVLAELEGALQRAAERRCQAMHAARTELLRAHRGVEVVLRLATLDSARERTRRDRAEE